MIKRKAHTFYSQERLNNYLNELPDFAKVTHFTVDDGMYYIIVEHEEVQPKPEYFIECTYRAPIDFEFTYGKQYEVFENDYGFFTVDDAGVPTIAPDLSPEALKYSLNLKYASKFNLIKNKAW